MWGASGDESWTKNIYWQHEAGEKKVKFFGFFRSQKCEKKEGIFWLVEFAIPRISLGLDCDSWDICLTCAGLICCWKSPPLSKTFFTQPHLFYHLHTNLEPHGHPFSGGLAIHWMMIPILYIGNDWITPNIHPFEKLCFFWGYRNEDKHSWG